VNVSFPPFGKDVRVTQLPTDIAVMLVGIAARQAASPTALFQARIAANPVEINLLVPADGTFNLAAARMLRRWKEAAASRRDV
jgi:hypothetical protein